MGCQKSKIHLTDSSLPLAREEFEINETKLN